MKNRLRAVLSRLKLSKLPKLRKPSKLPSFPKPLKQFFSSLFARKKPKTDDQQQNGSRQPKKRNGKLIYKLYTSYVLILVFMLAVGGVAIYAQQQIAAATQSLYEDRLQSVADLLTLSTDFEKLNSMMASALLSKYAKAEEQADLISELKAKVSDQIAKLKENQARYGIDSGDLETFLVIWNGYSSDLDGILEWIRKGDQAVGSSDGMGLAISTFNTKLAVKIGVLTEYLQETVALNNELARSSYTETHNLQQNIFYIQIGLVALAILLSIIIGQAMARSIVKPLGLVVHAAQEIAQGRLQQQIQINRRDELGILGEAFNQMSDNIRVLIRQVQQSSGKVTTSSNELMSSAEQTKTAVNQIATMIEEVASGAEVQVKSVEESKLGINEMVLGIQRITETAQVVSESSQDTAKEAEQGNVSIQKAINQMNTIESSVGESASAVKVLAEHSRNIGKIVNTITDIASQTNLLALNATIEAARAGEHGKGFAVVANEVRKLAEQTAGSAQQITKIIEEIQSGTNRAVDTMDKGTQEVQLGIEIVNEAGQAFEKILVATQHVADQIAEVSAVTEEISASSEEVAATVDELARIAQESSDNTQSVAATTQQQLAFIEEISSSVSTLNQMANELEDVMKRFEL
ncbi:methyl-accepting chemotaxis protein [Brevibacillus humidisoli]|uniref:methyl-accepting chemotaxis protein n=1 Tax=Brevibacillus humidisoli TaxID=2895522 RepID=UPI001E54E12D|nr:HAMP domain-containing methyl-accepting chemotaxis protein [Brevibacillus humidisoli]UFJ40877.1 methyl-accepting chemotaxis protein [Brevibacillus humidisoli]